AHLAQRCTTSVPSGASFSREALPRRRSREHHTRVRWERLGGKMTDELDRLIARKFGRRDLLRYAGVAAGAGVLAACKKATTSGSAVSGSPSTHPSISSEPGDLAVFDWAGYGGGEYYPGKEKANLWASYQKATGDTPNFILFAND